MHVTVNAQHCHLPATLAANNISCFLCQGSPKNWWKRQIESTELGEKHWNWHKSQMHQCCRCMSLHVTQTAFYKFVLVRTFGLVSCTTNDAHTKHHTISSLHPDKMRQFVTIVTMNWQLSFWQATIGRRGRRRKEVQSCWDWKQHIVVQHVKKPVRWCMLWLWIYISDILLSVFDALHGSEQREANNVQLSNCYGCCCTWCSNAAMHRSADRLTISETDDKNNSNS